MARSSSTFSTPARKTKKLPTSGGDVHDAESDAVGMAGVALPRPVTNGKELAELLRSGDYRLIINGELV